MSGLDNNFYVKNEKVVLRKLKELRENLDDARPLFVAIGETLRKAFNEPFSLKSSGKYADLKPATKRFKMRKIGRVYPILFLTGRLKNSLVNPRDKDHIFRVSRHSIQVGSKNPYLKYHHYGTRNLPQRKIVYINDRRLSAILSMIREYVDQKTRGFSR